MAYHRLLFGSQILEVKYEELTANPADIVRQMLTFLKMEWDPACLKFFERQSSVRTFSKDQIRRAINTNSIARWKNYEKHLTPLFEVLEAASFDYNRAV